MPIGVLLGLLSFSIYAVGDAITKGFAGEISVFELQFFINLFALVPIVFAKDKSERWRDTFKLSSPLLMHGRAFLYTAATLCFTFAVTTIPFAETYSLAFLSPLFLALLAMLILKEKVVATRWIFVALSFIGVLIVVRPGFRELSIGHLSAILCALLAASANTILRVISNSEKQISIIAINGVYQLVVCGTLMIIAGFTVPDLMQLARLATIGIIGGFAQILIIRAVAITPASHIGPTQYVQILWAVALGAIFFNETPDAIGYLGLAILVASGIATVFSDGAQARIMGRWSEFRARRGEPQTPIEGPDL
jgi:drug/metabolite transporter (DMT)-like permease